MRTYITVHAVARNEKGEYLILQRAAHRTNPGEWNFITGHIKERESVEDAALRELKEETNLEGEILGVSEPWWGDSEDKRFVIVSVLLKVNNPKDLKIDTEEAQAHQWIRPDEDIVQASSVMKEGFTRLGIF